MNIKRIEVFLEFLIFGIILGIIEDVVVIKLTTSEPITFHILWIIALVAIPFAFIGEYLIDRIDFLKLFNVNKKYRHIEVFLEFLIFGILMGIAEDAIALFLSTGTPITPQIVGIITLVTIPFAFIGEVVIDKLDFEKLIKKFLKE